MKRWQEIAFSRTLNCMKFRQIPKLYISVESIRTSFGTLRSSQCTIQWQLGSVCPRINANTAKRDISTLSLKRAEFFGV